MAPSGLVFNDSYRFNLGMSHIGIDAQWAREADTPPSRRSETSVTFRVVYSFRQQFAGNPTHSIIQTLPLLAMALPFVKRDDAHVLAHSPMFAALARQVLPADRVVLSSDWVWADRIHLVVVRPPFAVMQHVFPSGVLLVLRPVPPPQVTASRETLLYLARSSQAHRASRGGSTARVGVRSFDNEAEVLSRTGAGLRSAQNVRSLKLEVFDRFHTLRRQAQAFGRARIIAGPEGTAWSGVAFARQGVALVQWCGIRDGWSLAEYFGLGAAYYQLHPHWRVDPAVPSCAATGHIDECPWHLTPADLGVWDQLLAELLRDQGAALRRAGHVAPASPALRPSKRVSNDCNCSERTLRHNKGVCRLAPPSTVRNTPLTPRARAGRGADLRSPQAAIELRRRKRRHAPGARCTGSPESAERILINYFRDGIFYC